MQDQHLLDPSSGHGLHCRDALQGLQYLKKGFQTSQGNTTPKFKRSRRVIGHD